MKLDVTAGGVVATALIGGVGLWLFLNRDAIKGAVQAVNPASDKNIVYQTVNTATQAVTGQKGTSFGSWLYDVLNPHQPDPTAPTYTGDAWDQILKRKAAEALDGAGAVTAIGPTGAKEYALPANRQVWLALAAASAALYLYKHRGRRSRRVRRS